MYEKINDDWNEIGEIGGKACDLAASKSHVIIATDKGIYSRGKNDYGFGSKISHVKIIQVLQCHVSQFHQRVAVSPGSIVFFS